MVIGYLSVSLLSLSAHWPQRRKGRTDRANRHRGLSTSQDLSQHSYLFLHGMLVPGSGVVNPLCPFLPCLPSPRKERQGEEGKGKEGSKNAVGGVKVSNRFPLLHSRPTAQLVLFLFPFLFPSRDLQTDRDETPPHNTFHLMVPFGWTVCGRISSQVCCLRSLSSLKKDRQ